MSTNIAKLAEEGIAILGKIALAAPAAADLLKLGLEFGPEYFAAKDATAKEALVQHTAEEVFADVAGLGVKVGTDSAFVQFAEQLFGLAKAYEAAQAAAQALKAAAATANEPHAPQIPSASAEDAAKL